MPFWLQNLIVLAMVLGSAFVLTRQVLGTLRGGKRRLGACCCKGCPASAPHGQAGSAAVFIPAEMLLARRR